jgi:hypothetical protein
MNKQQRPSLEALAGAVAPTPDNVVPGPGAIAKYLREAGWIQISKGNFPRIM